MPINYSIKKKVVLISYSENLTLDEIIEDCNPVISELKKTLSLDLDVYLYNPEIGELVRSEKRNK